MSFWEDSSSPVELDRKGRGKGERAGLSVVIVIVLLLGALSGAGYVAAHAAAGDRVPRGTTISGVAVGGLTRGAAITRLRSAFAARSHTPIVLVATDATGADRTVTIRPARVGLRIDAAASVDQADPRRSWRPRRLWDYFSNAARLTAIATVDPDRLAARIRTMSGGFGTPPVNARIVFTRRGLRQLPGQAGDAVSLGAAVQAVTTAYVSDLQRARVPLVAAPPDIDQTDLAAALSSFARPAMSGPVTLLLGNRRLTLRPRQYAGALAMTPKGGRLVPHIRWGRLGALVAGARAAIAPRDATVRLVRQHPRVVSARAGTTFTDAAVLAAFRTALTAHGSGRTQRVAGTRTAASLSTSAAKALAIRKPIVSFTARIARPVDNAGVRAAAARVDGRVLRPGATLRLARGSGAVGVAVFGAAFRAGLEDARSGLPVVVDSRASGVPAGLEFRNDGGHGVLIEVSRRAATRSRAGSVRVRLWSTKDWDVTIRRGARTHPVRPPTRIERGPGCRPSSGVPGYTVAITRVFRAIGGSAVDHAQTFHAVTEPVDRVVCR